MACGRVAPLIVLMLAAAGFAQTGPATRPQTQPAVLSAPPGVRETPLLFAHGSGDWLWVGWTRPERRGAAGPVPAGDAPEFRTTLRARPAGGAWGELPTVGRPVASMANRGAQLALLLDSGEWLLMSPPDVAATGQPVPVPKARLLAFGNDTREQKLWALASLPGGVSALPVAATQPATAPATAPTPLHHALASLWPAPSPVLSLLTLGGDGWVGEGDLPEDVASPGDAVSFALLQDQPAPHLATQRRGEPLRVYHQDAGGKWAAVGSADVPTGRAFRLLAGTKVPVVWASGTAGEPDALVFFDAPGGAPRQVTLEASRAAPPNQRTAAYATGQIRAIYALDRKLFEQAYDPSTGAPAGGPLAVAWKTAPAAGPAWREMVVVAALLAATIAMFVRRDGDKPIDPDAPAVRPAPLVPRALAGLIDAIPVLAAIVYTVGRFAAAAADNTAPAPDPISERWLWAGIAVYIAHTLAAELLTGRSLGKAIFGLRVVSLDGTPPKPGQIAVRNLLRVIDAGLLFLPVLMIPFSPLHQRAGDAAAGTLVVGRGGVKPTTPEEVVAAGDDQKKA